MSIGLPGFYSLVFLNYLLKSLVALVGVAQWIECQPSNQKVTGSIPSQGACLGCCPGPQEGAHSLFKKSLAVLIFTSKS